MADAVREIPLTKGLVSLVDAADFEWLNQWKWCAGPNGKYAHRAGGRRGAPHISMHRFVTGAEPGQIVDHANGNTLDNRRANLRFCTHAQNVANAPKRKGGKFPYKGVSLIRGRYVAYIRVAGRSRHLGSHATLEAAARAYDAGAVAHFGEFARLNFPDKEAA